jgi:molecular chaperone GrpE
MSDPVIPDTSTSAPADPHADPPTASPLERERDDLHDRLLRTTAEFDNYRKRTERERREWLEGAVADLVRDLLPIVDDLERALAAAAPDSDAIGADPVAALRQGVELIHRQTLDVLRRRGIEPLDVIGQPFDPNWHEAVGQEPANGRPDGEIVTEVRRGYRLGQRLVRPAMVRVARA